MFNTQSRASGHPRLPPTGPECYCKHIRGIKLCWPPLADKCVHVGRSVILPFSQTSRQPVTQMVGQDPVLNIGERARNRRHEGKMGEEKKKLRQEQRDADNMWVQWRMGMGFKKCMRLHLVDGKKNSQLRDVSRWEHSWGINTHKHVPGPWRKKERVVDGRNEKGSCRDALRLHSLSPMVPFNCCYLLWRLTHKHTRRRHVYMWSILQLSVCWRPLG